MSLKDNFNQAVKELLKRDGLVGSDLSKEAKKKSELDRYIDPPNKIPENKPLKSIDDDDVPPMPESFGAAPYAETVKPADTVKPSFTPPPQQPSAPRSVSSKPVDNTPYFETEETTIISRNTVIDGNIRSFANITIEGSIKGDVQITKNASVSGKVVGDLVCNNATMLGSSMQGNVTSKGQVKLDRDSLLLGDRAAQYLDLNGKIKGNVEIGGKAEFKTDAIIFGNINAATITVLDGATIQGFVNTTFLQETASGIFPEAIAVSE